ncbi:hypothetical protein A8C46_08490 [Ligilactobacillus salivarius]|uniref:BppU family phage baseplate upper protein n=1 Tax=Ligilactobacillus salivarius TaxID=1624 RepID=UPI000A2DBFED|nr:BppU family phage baseplate upper protein [Ligilactobacillus salivarius]OTF89027.1 hypothetical protein A8C38_01495 [Ligilactobacillus salivarius]PAY42540.1 hypothetical protein A8C39_08400 [Ligilactobacillus salivarius]PAY48767.1 hypothetical protein A8C42_07845 [Ligilactobacillus salivarius]PAY52649.1 hypothetical protein A8C41_08920 [Ligilactobacillus salivarius]PAY56611.1 hypothetical protein A8C46_08490 [Ligilactobacillus salivarius]
MAQILKYVIGKDYRPLTVLEAKGGNTFSPDYDKTNWVQARQYEDSLRQVFVEITNEDGSAYDLTGANVLFEGILPDNEHKILDNSHVVFYEDPTTGKFRFDMPAQAFSVAGQYKQAFFRVVKDYRNIATLEFKFEVLADMVVAGMVARDYISPLDDLFNTIKETETKNVAELKKIVDDKINEITDLMTTLNQTNTATLSELNSAKTALETLEEKIKQDGLFTQGEAEEFKKSVKSDLEDLFTDAKKSMENQTVNDFSSLAITDPQNMYAEEMPPYFNDTFNHATNVPHGDNIVNIAFITDNHHEEDADPWSKKAYSGKSLEHYQWFAQGTLRTKPDVAIANGDNINGNTYRPTMIWTTMHVWAMLSTVYLKTALFMLPGNHDSGVGQTPKLVAEDAMTEHDLKNAYHTVKPLYGEVRNGDSLYFYKDLTDKKVRVIGLNSSDMPWTTDNQGNYVHNRLEEAGFGVAQLKWLVNVALKLPDNSWQVVFFFHHPLSTGTFYNAQALIDIIKAFKNGGSVVINRSDVDDMQIVGLKADFTTQGAGTVIGVFNGHYHADSQDLTTLNGTPIVITDASLSNSIGEQLERRNTPNEDCWETISIDTNARTIHCYRFGRGSDREFNY